MPALNGVVNIYSGAQWGDRTGQGLVIGVDWVWMHIIKPELELSNENGQSDSGSGWKERVGEEVEVRWQGTCITSASTFFSPTQAFRWKLMHCRLDMEVAVNQKQLHQSGKKTDWHHLPLLTAFFSLFLCVSSRGAAWPRSPWWRRPGWSRASSCCSPSSACSSSWWPWQCRPLSSACASARTYTWRRS